MAFGIGRRLCGLPLVFAGLALVGFWRAPLLSGAEISVRTPAEIRSAMANAKPGDTLVMANGEWRDATVTFEGHGTAEKPITLRAETPGKVVLSGQSRVRVGGSFLVVDGLLFRDGYLTGGGVFEFRSSRLGHATDSRLTNSAFIEYNPPDRETHYKWVSLFGARNRVDHCRFVGQDHVGQAINVWNEEEPNYHRIDHNFFGPRPPLGRNGGETLKIGNSTTAHWNSRTLVERNVFFECDGEGEIITNKSAENIYRSNTFIRSAGALTLRHGDRNRVEGNYFFGGFKEGTGGVRVINAGQVVVNNYFHGLTGRGYVSPLGIMNGKVDALPHEYYRVKDAVIAFNTFADCARPLVIGLGSGNSGMTLAPENLTIANNIFTATAGPIIEILDEPVSAAWQGNLVFGALVGISRRPGVVQADPLLEPGEDDVFRPGPGSPARSAAEGDFDWVEEDILGRTRQNPGDIGAHESEGAGAEERRPVRPGEVGPDWMHSPMEGWKSSSFSPAEWALPEVSGPEADAAGDGIPNLLRYALGMSPREHAFGKLPRLRLVGEKMAFVYRRAVTATDVEFRTEVSRNLRDWRVEDLPEEIGTPGADGLEEVRVWLAENDSGAPEFVRLRVRERSRPW